jgi:hypothetical protein
MEAPTVEITCPHCDSPVAVTDPGDAQLVDVFADPPQSDITERDRGVTETVQRKVCECGSVFAVQWCRRADLYDIGTL